MVVAIAWMPVVVVIGVVVVDGSHRSSVTTREGVGEANISIVVVLVVVVISKDDIQELLLLLFVMLLRRGGSGVAMASGIDDATSIDSSAKEDWTATVLLIMELSLLLLLLGIALLWLAAERILDKGTGEPTVAVAVVSRMLSLLPSSLWMSLLPL